MNTYEGYYKKVYMAYAYKTGIGSYGQSLGARVIKLTESLNPHEQMP